MPLRQKMSSGKICRSCLSAEQNLQRLDSVVSNGLTIADCLRTCLNIEVSENDGLPYTICLTCLTKLLKARKFLERYFESQAHLTNRHNSSTEQSPELTKEIIEMVTTMEQEVEEANAKPTEIEVKIARFSHVQDEYDDNETSSDTQADNFDFVTPDAFGENNEESDDSDQTQSVDLLNRKLIATIFCLQCSKEFPTRNDLRSHFHSIHGEDNARGRCIRCQKIFPNRGKLMMHLVHHENVKTKQQFQCEFCGRICLNQYRLDIHVLTHTGERPHVCPVCSRAFSQKSSLGTHMALHLRKNIPCPKCDKKFCKPSILRRHMRTHDDARPHVCHLCDRKFRIISHLKAHLLSHSDIRNHVCEICRQGFRDKIGLRSHMKVHTRPYKCPMCNLRSAQPYAFRIHLRKMHNIHDNPKKYLISAEGESYKTVDVVEM